MGGGGSESAICGPAGGLPKKCLLCDFVNQVLLEHSHAHVSSSRLRLLLWYTMVFGDCGRDSKMFAVSSFAEKQLLQNIGHYSKRPKASKFHNFMFGVVSFL